VKTPGDDRPRWPAGAVTPGILRRPPSTSAWSFLGVWRGRGEWTEPARATVVRAGLAAAIFLAGFAAGRQSGGPTVAHDPTVSGGPMPGVLPARATGGGEVLYAFHVEYEALRQSEIRTADSAALLLAIVPSAVPVDGGRITSAYTPRRFHPILRRVRPHWGVDIAAPAGTEVRAGGDGVVLDVSRNATYGLVVDVSHANGKYITRFAHLSVVLVREGEEVRRGDPVGRVGSTGLSTGPHLHYEVFVNGRRRDPGLLLDPGAASGLLPARVPGDNTGGL
jgi:murein DD-endopeptidase MepM/ murein hydrolase activator NlpD